MSGGCDEILDLHGDRDVGHKRGGGAVGPLGGVMTIRMKDGLMFGALSDPDAAVEHIAKMLDTKAAILEYVEPMAQALAAAGRASGKAMGDSAEYAVDQWSNVIRERALEILRAEGEEYRKEFKRKFEQIQKRRAK